MVNLSTPLGLGLALAGRGRIRRGPDGLLVAHAVRLPARAPSFTVGNVVLLRLDDAALARRPRLLVHEARHATQYACCGGLVMVPLYLAAAAVSWLLTGDTGCRNVFERRAGLTDGGYTNKPLRPALRRTGRSVAQAR